MNAAYKTALAHANVIGTASPVWHQINADAAVTNFPTAGSAAIIAGLRAKHVEIIPTVTTKITPQELQEIAASSARRAAHAAALAQIALSGDYDGLDLDYETIARTKNINIALKTRPAYTVLVQDVCAALHNIHKTCIITVMPRSSNVPTVLWWNRLAPAVYDYAAIGAAADRVRLMAYDEHAPGTTAGPVAPIGWVEQVVKYALSQIPAEKTELGIPLYGRDWGGKTVGTVTYPLKHFTSRKWDAATASPYFTYTSKGQKHIVWYSDAESIAARYQLARKYKLAGVALWAASQEDPATWERLLRCR